MKDIDDVGPNKPLGYVPVETIIDVCGQKLDEVVARSRARGLVATIFGQEALAANSLYVYDPITLQALLDEQRGVLEDARWPADAAGFVGRVATDFVDEYNSLTDVIANAFGRSSSTDWGEWQSNR